MVLTTKKCSTCGEKRGLSEFYKHHASKDGYSWSCKQCLKSNAKKRYAKRTDKQKEHTRKLDRERHKKNKERDRERINEYAKKYAQIYGRINYYRQGAGCCFYCWETNPFMLNNHHIWGRKNSDFTITLCENHHAPFSRGMFFVLEEWGNQQIEKNNT